MNFINTILQVVIDAFIYVLLIRLILQKLGANYFNQITQIVVRISNPLVKPVQRFIPGFKGFDLAILALAVVIQLCAILLLFGLSDYSMPGVPGILLVTVGKLGSKLVNIYFFAAIILGLTSWFPALQSGPASQIVHCLCDPILQKFRRFIPSFAGLDLSVLAFIVVLYLVDYLIFIPIISLGINL